MTPEQAAEQKALKKVRDEILQRVTNVAGTLSPALQIELHVGLNGLVALMLKRREEEEKKRKG